MFGKKGKATVYPQPLPKKKVLHSFDPLDSMEREIHVEHPERMHELAEKPTKPLKRGRSSPGKSYRPMHGGRK